MAYANSPQSFHRNPAYYSPMSIAHAQRTTRRAGRTTSGWVPKQHGAWAMLVTPFALGTALHVVEVGWAWYLLPLLACWLLGYFAFSAASLWLKSRFKPRFRRPVLAYAGLAGGFGVLALWGAGPALIAWAAVYLPLAALTLWLVAHRRERSTLSGLLTIAGAALMAVTTRYPDPASALSPGAAPAWWLAALSFAYFFGTVPYVKTLIRERGHRSWVVGSVAYHLIATLLVAAAAGAGTLSWAWCGFFAVATIRALVVPWAGPMAGQTVTPKQAGIGEVALTLLFAAIALTVLT